MASKKKWSDFTDTQKSAILLAASVELSLTATALADLVRRPREQVRGPKALWYAHRQGSRPDLRVPDGRDLRPLLRRQPDRQRTHALIVQIFTYIPFSAPVTAMLRNGFGSLTPLESATVIAEHCQLRPRRKERPC